MARPRQISDEQILASTKRLVLLHGPHVSLEVVAGDLGVTSPALLKRFGSRQSLLIKALAPPAEPDWVRVLEGGPNDTSLVAQLELIFTEMAEFMARVLPCWAALRQSGLDAEAWEPGKHQGPMKGIRAMQRWLELARERNLVTIDELETAASAIVGAAMSRIMMGHLFKQHWAARSQATHFHELAELFARALTAPRPPKSPASSRGTP